MIVTVETDNHIEYNALTALEDPRIEFIIYLVDYDDSQMGF
jgi:hypothetical protein